MIFRNNTVTMTKKELKAMLTFASDDEKNLAMYGVMFQDDGVVAATNGYRMVVHSSDGVARGCDFGLRIVHRDVVETALKELKKSDVTIRFMPSGRGSMRTEGLELPDGTHTGERDLEFFSDQTPPNFMRIFPAVGEKTNEVHVCALSADNLADLAVIQSAARESNLDIRFPEDPLNPVDVWIGPQWRVLMAPVRM